MDEQEELFFSSEDDHQAKDLELLLHSFSSVSLEEIASAYCRAGGDVEVAADILSGLQKRDLDQLGKSDDVSSLEPMHLDALGADPQNNRRKSTAGGSNFGGPKPLNSPQIEGVVACMQKNVKGPKDSKSRKAAVSIGTISSVLGKGYARSGSFQRESCRLRVQPRPTVKDLRESDMSIYATTSVCHQTKTPDHKKSVEEFLFPMFGDRCHLDMDAVTDALSNCGHDVQQLAGRKPEVVAHSFDEEMLLELHAHSEHTPKPKESESCAIIKRSNLEREVLESLFRMPEESKQLPKKSEKVMVRKAKTVLQSSTEASPVEPNLHPDEDKDNLHQKAEMSEYHTLRRSVQWNWDAMRTYYEAAAEAHLKGNLDQSRYLLEEGEIYNKKARDLDEQSGKIFEASNMGQQPDVILDVHDHGKWEAMRLLKFHLLSLSGISSIQFLKVIAEIHPQPGLSGSLRKLITKFLDKEHIKWQEEEGNPGTIIVYLEDIERDKLSFADDKS